MFVKHPAVPHRHHRCHEHSCSQCADDGTADSERDRKTSCVQKDARYSAFVPNARSLLTPDMGIDRSYLSPAEQRGGGARRDVPGRRLRAPGGGHHGGTVGQQEIHEHEALGGGHGRRLYCRLTSLSRACKSFCA